MIQVLELFGGIGAPRKALLNLGIDHKLIDYVEIDAKAVQTYNALYQHLSKHRPQSVVGFTLKPDILIHGSPCQDFSRAGKRLGGKDEDKTRSSLMWETLRIIKSFGDWMPKVVIWENVKGVLAKDMIGTFRKYLRELEALGYSNSYQVLNAMDFGIPQNRDRLFTVSILGEQRFDWSRIEYKQMQPIANYLEDTDDDKYIVKSPSMINKIAEYNPPKPSEAYQRRLDVIHNYTNTITTKQNRCPNSGIIRLKDGRYRTLTERECWRLMGFDDQDFDRVAETHQTRDGCTNGTLYHQAGNSIVVDVLEAIFKVLLNTIQLEDKQ
jgi:DNA (cytosine-5)-methyltransferase 1